MSKYTNDMTVTITQLVHATRAGDKHAKAELERRAAVNGSNSRAAKALEGLKNGGPATIGEFFAGVKAGTIKPASKPKAPAAKRQPKAADANMAWNFVAPNGKTVNVTTLADNLGNVVAKSLRQAMVNTLTK